MELSQVWRKESQTNDENTSIKFQQGIISQSCITDALAFEVRSFFKELKEITETETGFAKIMKFSKNLEMLQLSGLTKWLQ